jgi:hypothetical protein
MYGLGVDMAEQIIEKDILIVEREGTQQVYADMFLSYVVVDGWMIGVAKRGSIPFVIKLIK